VERLDAQEVNDLRESANAVKDLRSPKKEILREMAKLNPEDPRMELWKNVYELSPGPWLPPYLTPRQKFARNLANFLASLEISRNLYTAN
jgi:hypothetical protein